MQKYIKDKDAINKMRKAGELASQALEMITPYVQEGISTLELDSICHNYIVNSQKAYPAPLNYHGFPKSICTSINDVICHGIPSSRILRSGDIINIDITVLYDGYHGDTSAMFAIGQINNNAKKLIQITQDCLYMAIATVAPGVNIKKIGHIIQSYAHYHNYSVVESFCGHGIGTEFHESGFQVMHYYNPWGEDFILQEGMTFTIEPMINTGKKHCKILKDKWTAVTKDGSLSAQWEHTILVTSKSYEILTLRKNEIAEPSQEARNWLTKKYRK